MLYMFSIIKRIYKCLLSWAKHTHMITSKWFRFIIAKIYNILRYVIARILRHMCNLHIKETEISQKRSKGIKNWKITYSVILSVLSNKTNLILGFSSPLIRWLPGFFYDHARTGCKFRFNQWAPYISGVRSSGHRVKPNMAAMEALSYVGSGRSKTWVGKRTSYESADPYVMHQQDWH